MVIFKYNYFVLRTTLSHCQSQILVWIKTFKNLTISLVMSVCVHFRRVNSLCLLYQQVTWKSKSLKVWPKSIQMFMIYDTQKLDFIYWLQNAYELTENVYRSCNYILNFCYMAFLNILDPVTCHWLKQSSGQKRIWFLDNIFRVITSF